MDFRWNGCKSIRELSSSRRTEIRKKYRPFGLAVQADLPLWRIGSTRYPRSPSEATTPSSTANALRKDYAERIQLF